MGSQPASIKKRSAKIITSLVGEVNDFNVVSYAYGETPISTIIADAKIQGLGGKKVIEITNPTFLMDYKEEEVSDLESLLAFMRSTNEVYFIFELVIQENQAKKGVFKKSELISNFLKNVTLETIADIGKNDWPVAVKRLLVNRGYTMSDDALTLFLERTGHDLTLIINELDKLGTYSSNISYDDVKNLVAVPLEDNFFKIADALIHQQSDVALNTINDLFIQKYEPSSLISLLAGQFHFMYQVKYLSDCAVSTSEIGEILNVTNPYRVQMVQNQLYGVSQADILYLIECLGLLDYQIMTGQIERHLGLELLCLECLR